MKVVTLGTGGAIPTARRSLPATALIRQGEMLLFDCGEGAQLQMRRAHTGFGRLTKVFISHLHGDHLAGLPGLLMTMALLSRDMPLKIFGPPGLKRFVKVARETFRFRSEYQITVLEIEGGRVDEGSGYRMEARPMDHSIFTLGYALIEQDRPGEFDLKRALELGVPEGPLFGRLQRGQSVTLEDGRVILPQEVLGSPRKGRKFVYALDTRPCRAVVELAKDADFLLHDGMFAQELVEDAHQMGHSTAAQAAQIAKEAGVRQLLLSHISQRYRDERILLQEAREIFPRTAVARDLMSVEIPLRGLSRTSR
jgi:ribonuclease Z